MSTYRPPWLTVIEKGEGSFCHLLDSTPLNLASNSVVVSLCSSCSQLPFDKLFKSRPFKRFNLGTFLEIREREHCVFCSFVAAVSQLFLPEDRLQILEHSTHGFKVSANAFVLKGCGLNWSEKLLAPCTSLVLPILELITLCPVLTSPRELAVARIRTEAEVVRGEIHIDLVKSWLATCVADHNKCQQRLSNPELQTYLLPNFIDVKSNAIVHGIGVSDYVALSDVWGPTGEINTYDKDNSSKPVLVDPTNHNQTKIKSIQAYVEHPCLVAKDAINLTKQLGYRYLWVDEYCIPRDSRQRQLHIDQMD